MSNTDDVIRAYETDAAFDGIAAGIPASMRPAQDPDRAPVSPIRPETVDYLVGGPHGVGLGRTPEPEMCDHVNTERVTRTAHGYLGDAPAGTVETLCADCGAEVDHAPACDLVTNTGFACTCAPPVSTRAWLASVNYGATPGESWD